MAYWLFFTSNTAVATCKRGGKKERFWNTRKFLMPNQSQAQLCRNSYHQKTNIYPHTLAFAGPDGAIAEVLLPKPWRMPRNDFLFSTIHRWLTPSLTTSTTRSATCHKAMARRLLRTRSVINTAPIWCSSLPSIPTPAASGKGDLSKPSSRFLVLLLFTRRRGMGDR